MILVCNAIHIQRNEWLFEFENVSEMFGQLYIKKHININVNYFVRIKQVNQLQNKLDIYGEE